VYDYTKDWKNSDVIDIFNTIEKEFDENYRQYTRIREIWITVMFGLYIFSNVFKSDFDVFLKKYGIEILELLAAERRKTFDDFGFQFHEFCMEAINYDYGKDVQYKDGAIKHVKGDNPNYINHPLIKDMHSKSDDCFVFTSKNNIDFNRTLEKKLSINKIHERLIAGLKDKSLLIFSTHNLNGHSVKGIKIKNEWWNLYKEK
jgi:hypothetical protein